MEIGLHRLVPGAQGVVTKLEGEFGVRKRLEELGLVPGTMVKCRYRSPGGFVTALEFRGTVLALRTRDLRHIRVDY